MVAVWRAMRAGAAVPFLRLIAAVLLWLCKAAVDRRSFLLLNDRLTRTFGFMRFSPKVAAD